MSWQMYVQIAAFAFGISFCLMIADRKSPKFTRHVYYALILAAFFMFSIFMAASGYLDPWKCLSVGLTAYAVGIGFWYYTMRSTGFDTIQGDELTAAVGKDAADLISSLRAKNKALKKQVVKLERMFVDSEK